ncbi:hypothetical protein [Saccharopolyspora taberi]|uniref:hypothetical protein n=1 Tax=Saccharopolyspora taberi TaxID=60895 RepID=UPI0031CEFC84
MTTPADTPKPLLLSDCARLLGCTRLQMWFLHKLGRFAPPAGEENGKPYWHKPEVYRWAAGAGRPLVRRVPVRYWPDAAEPADYLGTREVPNAVAQVWGTETGRVCVVWPLPEVMGLPASRIAAHVPEADTLIRVQGDFGLDGPGLATAEPGAQPDWTDFGVRWSDLVRVLGQPAPYWPYMLRIPHLIQAWEPGADTVEYPTVPEVNTTPLLRLAAALPADSPAHQVLMYLAQITQHRSHTSAVQDLEILDEHVERASVDNPVVIAARPMPVPDVEDEGLEESTWRAGWMEILGRTDQLAVECVHQASRWDGGAGFPYSKVERFDPAATPHGTEWAARLEPTVRTAAFERIDPDGRGETLIDPATDAPAVRRPDGEITAAVPQRLTTISPLAEIILGDPIWIRVEDGTLYLAPKHHYFGLSWGYGGSGPGSLALLIHRLLDDITSPAADHVNGAAEGLETLTQHDWPAGTVLTRVQLEAARDGRPYAAD